MLFRSGLQMNGRQAVFSPNIFADGVFPSLGALLIINTFILIINLCTFFIKGRISQFLTRNESRKRTRLIIYCIGTLMETAAICAYGFLTLRSFILNSNVTLELYKISSNFTYPAVIYLSYTGLAHLSNFDSTLGSSEALVTGQEGEALRLLAEQTGSQVTMT